MSEQLDRTLDDIVKETRPLRRRGRGGRGTNEARPRQQSAPYTVEKPRPQPQRRSTATKILVENLHPNVNDADMKELFSQMGPLKKAAVHYNSQARSLGTAEITFNRPEDAARAVREYNGLTLDGRPMKLALVDEEGKSNVLSRIAGNPREQRAPNNRRENFNSGRGGRNQRGGRAPRAAKEPAKSQADLDAELDSYQQ
eukprot:Ihof_evm3s460 gene=Ihof_evmTU3s460